MTTDEFKSLHPQDTAIIQIDDTERTMTDEEYEAWVLNCVYYINHPLP